MGGAATKALTALGVAAATYFTAGAALPALAGALGGGAAGAAGAGTAAGLGATGAGTAAGLGAGIPSATAATLGPSVAGALMPAGVGVPAATTAAIPAWLGTAGTYAADVGKSAAPSILAEMFRSGQRLGPTPPGTPPQLGPGIAIPNRGIIPTVGPLPPRQATMGSQRLGPNMSVQEILRMLGQT